MLGAGVALACGGQLGGQSSAGRACVGRVVVAVAAARCCVAQGRRATSAAETGGGIPSESRSAPTRAGALAGGGVE